MGEEERYLPGETLMCCLDSQDHSSILHTPNYISNANETGCGGGQKMEYNNNKFTHLSYK